MLNSANKTEFVEKENHNPFRSNNKSKSLTTVRQLLVDMDISTKKRQLSQRKREPCLDREEIRKHMKQKWKDPGFCNIEFNHYKALKGRFLNEWEIQRICLANRSYQYPKDFKGYKQCAQSKQFPKVPKEMYSEKFQKYLSAIEDKNESQMFRPRNLRTQIPTTTFRNRTFVPKQKEAFQGFTTQNKAFGMGTVIWKKGEATRKLKTLDY